APLTTAETSPPFEVKVTFAATTSSCVGLNRTTTVWLLPRVRLKEPPETMLKGGAAATVPVRVPPPELRTTKVLSAEFPRFTVPKSCESGVTDRAGGVSSSPSRTLSARSTWILGRVVPVPARGSVIGSPVLVSASRISSTVAVGAACFRMAQAPATCGAAIDVPLDTAKLSPGYREMISSPGANSDRKGATFEKSATRSSFVVAPTLTALDTHAGALSWLVDPSLPDAMTVAMPAARRLSMNGLYGSSSQAALNSPPPRLMLTEAKSCVVRSSYTRSRAARMSDVNAPRHGGAPPQSKKLLILEKTWTAMMLAPRPTPEIGRSNNLPSAATMPATCVPCQQPSGSSEQ